MRFTAIKPQTLASEQSPSVYTESGSLDVLSITANASTALLLATDSSAVIQALLTAAVECGGHRPRVGLRCEPNGACSMWQLDGGGNPVACGTAPASLFAGGFNAGGLAPGSLIPIAGPDHEWGFLDIGSGQPDSEAISALTILATQAAMALHRGHAQPTVSHTQDGFAASMDEWWEQTDADALFLRVLSDLSSLTKADSCSVTLLDSQPGAIRCLFSEDVRETSSTGPVPWLASPGERRNRDAVMSILRNGAPVAFRWNPTSEALKAGFLPSGPEQGSYSAQPIRFADTVVGVLDIRSDAARAFDAAEDSVLSLAARTVGRVLEQKKSEAIAVESGKRQNVLDKLNLDLSDLSEAVDVANAIVQTTRTLWPEADLIYCMLPRLEGGLWSIAALDSLKQKEEPEGWVRCGEGFAGWVIQTRQPLSVTTADNDPRRGALDCGQNIQSGVWAPLQRSHGILGLIAVAFTESNNQIPPEDVELLEKVAERGAMALERIRDRSEAQAAFWDLIEVTSAAIDARDGYTHGHSRNVTEYSLAIAQRLGLSQQEQNTLRAASLLHDIGKIGIRDHILNKPGQLTPDERKVMESHPEVGHEILLRGNSLHALLPTVRFHHERPDGKGYPQGLTGNALPRQALIVAVADAFDAMTSDRIYRRRMPVDKAVTLLVEGRGTQWDAECVDAFVAIVEERGTPHLQMLMAEDSGRQYLHSIGPDVFGT